MTSSAPRAETRVAVFAKAPVPGEVKTRSSACSAPSARRACTRRWCGARSNGGGGAAWARSSSGARPIRATRFFARCAAEFGVALLAQRGADLGERMAKRSRRALRQCGAGADRLRLPRPHARAAAQAARALATHDAVIAPAEDGGYVLVGLRARRGIFDGIAWAEPR
jgi:glycosyltransferase A (GT-A) superfamily protein (DUF2064 family)